jgi:DNA processing protein
MTADRDLVALVSINLADGIGWTIYSRLLERFGSPSAVLEASMSDLKSVQGVGQKRAASLKTAGAGGGAEAELELAAANGIAIVPHTSPRYPKSLLHIPDPPLVLYVKGELKDEDAIALAFVGSRRASLYGLRAARKLAGQAARAGFVIVSGLARGIDRAAHEAALDVGGRTIGVAGSGLLELYPEDAGPLVLSIAKSGAVLSEFPLKFPPLRESFPRRNRIISGLSLGVVVVEAAKRSGSLITARHAAEQGREVFAVPGPIDSPASFGPNRLIQEGAALVMDLADVTAQLGVLEDKVDLPGAPDVKDLRAVSLNAVERSVFEKLDREPRGIEDIIAATELDASTVSATLMILEMKRLVTQISGQRFAKS